MAANVGTLPFNEAIDFIKNKIDIPTETYQDITDDMHGRGFVVAGAMKQEIVADFHKSILKAIEDGTDIAEFRKDFDKIVKKHGWSYKGERGWRTSVILDTNLSSAYSAGREKQRRTEAVLTAFPNDEYITEDDELVRASHKAWHGTILPNNNEWWETHTPPNGWNDRCHKSPTADKTVNAPVEGTETDINPQTHVEITVPEGITPGFAFNPADAAWGRPTNKNLIDKSILVPAKGIKPLKHTDYNRKSTLPIDTTKAKAFKTDAKNETELRDYLNKSIGGQDGYSINPLKENIYESQAIADFIMDDKGSRLKGQEKYFPFIKDTIEKPYEVWVNFEQNLNNGKVLARQHYIKRLKISKSENIIIAASAVNNMWSAFQVFDSKDNSINKFRVGRMIYGR